MFGLKHKFPKHSGAIFAMSFLFTLVFAVVSPVFPLYIKSLVKSDTLVGLVVSLSSIEWIIFTVAMGFVLKKAEEGKSHCDFPCRICIMLCSSSAYHAMVGISYCGLVQVNVCGRSNSDYGLVCQGCCRKEESRQG